MTSGERPFRQLAVIGFTAAGTSIATLLLATTDLGGRLAAVTPYDVKAWSEALRVDPLVLAVGVFLVRELRRQHADAMGLMRSLRDEMMVLTGRYRPVDHLHERRRTDPPTG
jgi:hypothetical protein